MIINGVETTVNEAIELSNIKQDFLKRRENGLLLSDYQINVLNQNGINYKRYNNLSSLLFDLEKILNEEENTELEEISKQLSEIHYYNEVNK